MTPEEAARAWLEGRSRPIRDPVICPVCQLFYLRWDSRHKHFFSCFLLHVRSVPVFGRLRKVDARGL